MLDPRVKLRHLRTFVEVTRRNSVGQAAVALAVSQPAVSKTLKELETILGVRLMERGRAGVALAPVGEMFLHYACASIAALVQGAGPRRRPPRRAGEYGGAQFQPSLLRTGRRRRSARSPAAQNARHRRHRRLHGDVPGQGDRVRDRAEKLLITNGIGRLPDRIETVERTFGRLYVRRSDAVWFIAHGVVALDLADGLLVELPFDVPRPSVRSG